MRVAGVLLIAGGLMMLVWTWRNPNPQSGAQNGPGNEPISGLDAALEQRSRFGSRGGIGPEPQIGVVPPPRLRVR